MGLSCECDYDWYPDPGEWFWADGTRYKELPFKRRKKCCSCGENISSGALSLEHPRAKVPNTDVELKIFGEEGQVPLASYWMCERCGDLYLSIVELGYCVNPCDDMRELAKEYAADHAAKA